MAEHAPNVRQTSLRRWEVCWGCEHHANFDVIEAVDYRAALELARRVFADIMDIKEVGGAEAAPAQRSEAEEPSEAVRCSELLGVASRGPKNHLLKCWPAFYGEVAEGRKPFECRKADRDFRVGDTLVLEEWNPETHAYTGSVHRAEVTYLMRGPALGVAAGWVVLGLATFNGALNGEGTGDQAL